MGRIQKNRIFTFGLWCAALGEPLELKAASVNDGWWTNNRDARGVVGLGLLLPDISYKFKYRKVKTTDMKVKLA